MRPRGYWIALAIALGCLTVLALAIANPDLLGVIIVYGFIAVFVTVAAGIFLFLLLWNLRMAPLLIKAIKSLLTGDADIACGGHGQ
jgi:hypothetical protein